MSSSAITGPILADNKRAPAGTAAAPSFAFNDSTGTGVYLVSAGVLGLSTAGVQRVVVDASGNVGIGTESPRSTIEVSTASETNVAVFGRNGLTQQVIQTDGTINLLGGQADGNGPSIVFNHLNVSNGSNTGQGARIVGFRNSVGSDRAMGLSLLYANGVGASTESMRIDASGNLLVGTTSSISAARVSMFKTSGDILGFKSGSTSYVACRFQNNSGSNVGAISVSTTATAYVTSSDYRLKEDIKPMEGALAKVSALKPCTYKWKADGSEGEGFIAHELAEVCPLAVSGEKDAVDEDGSIKSQGIDPSKLVGLLTAAIQELKAELDEAKAKIAALESKP